MPGKWRLLGESNPRSRHERAMSWATRRRRQLGGAWGWNRTSDARLFRPPLYQLSYRRTKMTWCPRRESNPHALRHGALNAARLPFPPPGQGVFKTTAAWINPSLYRIQAQPCVCGTGPIRTKGSKHARLPLYDGCTASAVHAIHLLLKNGPRQWRGPAVLASKEGLEPSTYGFGDRRSAS